MPYHPLAGCRVLEGQIRGMEQHLSWLPSLAIEPVANDGDAQAQRMSGVQAQLMGAPGQGGEFDPAALAFDALEPPAADAHLPVQRVMDLVGPVVRVQAEWQGDFARLPAQSSFQQGDISLVHQSFRKLEGKMAMGRAGPGHNHQAGGIHVEPVYGWLVDAVREQRLDPVYYAVLHV